MRGEHVRARGLPPILVALMAAVLAACGGSHEAETHASPSANADEIAFAQLMIPHHQQAVAMADLALAQGQSPEVEALAWQIKAAQQPEIDEMSAWLTKWGAPSAMPHATESGDHDGMDMGGLTMSGMQSEEQLAALAAARGRAFDRIWLGMMIEHHEGAIAMAKQVDAATTNPEVTALAAAIIAAQAEEIAVMQRELRQ